MNSHASKIWVRIYAILGMIGSIFLFVFSLSVLTEGSNILLSPILDGASNGLILSTGIILLLISIGLFLTYLFFYKIKRWARIVVIIFTCISLLCKLLLLIISLVKIDVYVISLLISFLISLWFFYVITFDKGTKELFKK